MPNNGNTDVERYVDLDGDGEINSFEIFYTAFLRAFRALPEYGPNIIEANNQPMEPAHLIPTRFGPWVVQEWDRRDVILGTGQDDQDFGEQPRINGTSGRDWIFGLRGDDEILAGGGDDNIDGGAGEDVIDAGEGDDIIGSGTDGDNDVFIFTDSDNARDALHIHRAFDGQASQNSFGSDRIVGFGAEDEIWLENGLQLLEIASIPSEATYSIVDENNRAVGVLTIEGDYQNLDIHYVG